ncbi:MAG: sodium:solute symporter family transporter, partial [Planctomycetota bacterium]
MTYLIAIFIYLLVLAGIGIYKSRQVKTQEDFTVAGRTLSPWVMVCTMLAVWIGTGSIVGNAEKTYETGMAALILPVGTFIGMILLSLIASRARNIEASSVPEIIGGRFGQAARGLAVISLIIAYMVIVSYQFNAGGAVLEVITGEKASVTLQTGDRVTAKQLTRGWVIFTPGKDWRGQTSVSISGSDASEITYYMNVVTADEIAKAKKELQEQKRSVAIRENNYKRILYQDDLPEAPDYTITSVPDYGLLELREPRLTKETATIIAATAIILFTVLAGLMSLAYADIVTGIIITAAMLITFPIYWFKAGGWEG